jgi:four helix bundle protein
VAGVKKFEDLDAWKKSCELALRIYKLTNKGDFSRDFGFRDQIRRAAVSVMSDIAEGFERGSRPDFHRFLVIAKASCAEVRSQLYLALDIGYLTQDEFTQAVKLAEEASRIIGGLRRSVDPNNNH